MSDSDPSPGASRAWARIRFLVVGSLLLDPPSPGDLGDAIQALAERDWPHPTQADQRRRFGFSTIERWFYAARDVDDPIAALDRATRKDAGVERVMTPAIIAALGALYVLYPGWTYQLHADNLAAEIRADPDRLGTVVPSYPTVRRAMQRRGWLKRRCPRNPTPGQSRALRRLEQRERRGYEAAAVHGLWHLDFHEAKHRRVVDAAGNWHTPVLLAIHDDRSRLCAHAQWYYKECAENLIHGLKQALLKRGLPRGLMHDNGGAMIAAPTRNGLLRLGVAIEPTLPYSPDQNGKQERFWDTVEGRLMPMLRRVEPLTLDLLNRATAAWVEGDYNNAVHDETKQTPIARALAGPDVARSAPANEALTRAFTELGVRTQRAGDGTVSIGGVRFEVPSRLRTLRRVTVRWQPWDLSIAWAVDAKTDDLLATLYPIDRERSAARGRRALEPLPGAEAPPAPDPDADVLPPLLRELLRDYAATGMPPSYLPKDEVSDA